MPRHFSVVECFTEKLSWCRNEPVSTTVYSQVHIYTAEQTGASMERTKMPNLRNGNKEGFEPGLT